MRVILLTILTSWFVIPFLQAQSLDRFVIGTTGGFGTNSTNEVEFTVGELITTTITGGNFTLNQGFQQSNPPYNTGLEPEAVNVSYLLYPNPTTGMTTLELESPKQVDVNIEIWDARGRSTYLPAQTHSFTGKKVIQLDLASVSQGIYMLRFSDQKGTFLKTLRIEKR
ncbi:MAG: T9SS type A sorting domain-containing protein [Bacteroidetes bacterium]|nr:T9SS type A sorting domain-containing protein [Bacteroidota bacterium]